MQVRGEKKTADRNSQFAIRNYTNHWSAGCLADQRHQMNNPHPYLPDVVGKLGPPDNEYAVCPTPDVNCSPPFFTIHFSYEITFQRVR